MFSTGEDHTMPEVNGPQAAEIIGKSIQTIHRRVDDGTLPAREEGAGERKFVYIEIDSLRQFATKYGYRFDETIAAQYIK
jgi:predicted DNA-binding transcriptional regulator AlpA